MAELRFLPVCMNCRSILDDQLVDVEYEEVSGVVIDTYVVKKSMTVKPVRCPKCNQEFSCLTIQSRLPFYPIRSQEAIEIEG